MTVRPSLRLVALVAAGATLPLALGAVTLPHAFSNGTLADASAVNANFAALDTAVDALENRASRIVYFRDEKPAGTTGGASFAANTWVQRNLNVQTASRPFVTAFAANQFTLAPGTYRIRGRAPARHVGFHKAILFNVTDGATALVGESAASLTGNSQSQTDSAFEGLLTLAAAKTFDVRHRCTLGGTSYALGEATGIAGYVEVYTTVMVEKLD